MVRLLSEKDRGALEMFLSERLETSMFLLANSRKSGFGNGDTAFHGSYAGAFDAVESKLEGVVVHYRHGFLILQMPAGPDEFQVALEMVLTDSGRPIKGVIGIPDQVDAALDFLQISESEVQSDSVEYLYQVSLDELQIPDGFGQEARLANQDDIPVIVDWMVRYRNETLEDPDTPEQRESCRARTLAQIEEKALWVLQRGDELVSMCAYNAKIDEAVQIGGVFTPGDHRNKGFARYLVAQSLLAAREEGVGTGLLFTAMTNYPAQKAYQSLGFREIGKYRICCFNPSVEMR